MSLVLHYSRLFDIFSLWYPTGLVSGTCSSTGIVRSSDNTMLLCFLAHLFFRGRLSEHWIRYLLRFLNSIRRHFSSRLYIPRPCSWYYSAASDTGWYARDYGTVPSNTCTSVHVLRYFLLSRQGGVCSLLCDHGLNIRKICENIIIPQISGILGGGKSKRAHDRPSVRS